MMKDSTRAIVAGALRAALILALLGAGWSIYQRLPDDDSTGQGSSGARARETRLRILLRRAQNEPPSAGKIPFQLYPIDVEAAQRAAQREFLSEPPRGSRLEDFMTRRMGGRAPLEGHLDERGEAVMAVPSGKWWVHATLPGTPELTWRLPVNVAGREQTIELTTTNVYARTKSF